MPVRKMRLSVTAGLPFVSVPVLSNITILTRVALSSASAPCNDWAPLSQLPGWHMGIAACAKASFQVSEPACRTAASGRDALRV